MYCTKITILCNFLEKQVIYHPTKNRDFTIPFVLVICAQGNFFLFQLLYIDILIYLRIFYQLTGMHIIMALQNILLIIKN